MKKNLLVLMPISYSLTEKKGTLDLLKEYGCNGYFNKVIIWGFNCENSSSNQLDETVTIIETKKKFNNKFLDFFYYLIVGFYIVKNHEINLIRATEASIRGMLGYILSKIYKLPFCVSVHADYDKCYELAGSSISPVVFGSRKIAVLLEKFIIKRADLLMPIRETLLKKMIERGGDKKKIMIIPHGIDIDGFIESGKNIDIYGLFDIPEKKKIISYAGRLSKENYIYETYELARRLKKDNIKDVLIVVAGGGGEKNILSDMIEKEKLFEYIQLIGNQDRSVISALRQSSYINLCLMGGFSLIEACAAGRPVISFNIEWHYELVKNEETGFLVEEKNVDELYKTILILLNNKTKCDELGENAKKLVYSRHTIDNSIKIKIRCYEKLYALYSRK